MSDLGQGKFEFLSMRSSVLSIADLILSCSTVKLIANADLEVSNSARILAGFLASDYDKRGNRP
jgi:hypothetical protein